MTCKVCGKKFEHPRAIADHWKKDHPKESKAKERLKNKRAAARVARENVLTRDPEDVVTLEGENELLVNTTNAWDQAGLQPAAYDRIATYLSQRFGVPAVAE